MTHKNVRIAVIHNEPTVETSQGRRYFYEVDAENQWSLFNGVKGGSEYIVDLSEVGVIEERIDVCHALEEIGYETIIFNVDENIKGLIDFLSREKPDLIFNLCESLGSNSLHEMHVCSIFEILGIPYTGSSPFTLGLCLNKVRTKEVLSYHGIPTPRFCELKGLMNYANKGKLSLPVIVKPALQDASVGIDNGSVVHDWKTVQERAEKLLQEHKHPVIVEEFIQGQEINVAIIGNDPPEVLPLSEIDFSGLPEGIPRIVSYKAKWLRGSLEFKHTVPKCPAIIPVEAEKQIKELALKVFRLLCCRDYARVDVRLNSNLQPFVIEVNPNPDLCDDAGFARSGKAAGMDYHELVRRIVDIALARTTRTN